MNRGKLTILRGLPGSGKSTRAKKIRDETGALIISNDDFFTDAKSGTYQYDAKSWTAARDSCRFNVVLAMKKGVPHIVVDNCFIFKNPIEWYRDLAFRHGYDVAVEMVGSVNPEAVTEYKARQVHNVPENVFDDMVKNFQK